MVAIRWLLTTQIEFAPLGAKLCGCENLFYVNSPLVCTVVLHADCSSSFGQAMPSISLLQDRLVVLQNPVKTLKTIKKHSKV